MAVIKIVPMPGAVGDKGDEGAVGPQGQQGETGLQGPAGADALWSYNGEYNPGAGYAVGDVVTYDGQLWYRKNSNGGNVGDTPSEGLFWDLLAAKGADGNSSDIADFIFTLSGSGPYNTNSSIKIIDHDMRLRTEKSNPAIEDADIVIDSADNVTITAEAHITMIGSNGEFLGNPTIPENQIATLGDLPTGATGTFETPDSKIVTVTNGIITSIDPLT